MSSLKSEQLKQYENKGYVAPIDVLSKNEAFEIRSEIENIEKNWPEELEGLGRNYIHLISPVFDKVSHNSKILDAVESIIGKNILICGTTLFIKNPNVTDTNEENGCMRMWSGSHKADLKHHNQKFDENNLLTRGQTIENIPIDKTEPVVLKAGQMSLHHPKVVHGSGLNNSNDRRIGFVIQSYIGTDVTQVLGKMYVQLARGKDSFNHHEHAKRAVELMSEKDILLRKKANEELSKIFYSGSKKIGKF